MHRNTLAVVHGESERILVSGISRRLRFPIDVYPLDRGSGTIDLPNIGNMLSSGPFRNESALHQMYPGLDYESGKAVRMSGLRIFTIMDVDRHRDHLRAYRSGDVFRDSVFRGRIVPIYNDRDLDEVMESVGFTVNRADKVGSYLGVVRNLDVRDLYRRLKASEDTNLDLLLLWVLSRTPPYTNEFRDEAVKTFPVI